MRISEALANITIIDVAVFVALLAAIAYLLPKYWKKPAAKQLSAIAQVLAGAMALVFLTSRLCYVQSFYIPSRAMTPTLQVNDRILVNKLVYRLREPMRMEVVVFKAPPSATPDNAERAEAEERNLSGQQRAEYVDDRVKALEKVFIKRVIGMPGDTVYITKAYAIIDDVEYDRTSLRSLLPASGRDKSVKLLKDSIMVDDQKITIPEIAKYIDNPKARIKIFPGTVYVNGKPLLEPYIAEDSDFPYPYLTGPEGRRLPHSDLDYVVNYKGHKAIKIPPGKLLVMGDNRNDSNDARFWGLLDRNRVSGKAMYIFLPLNRVRTLR